MSRRRPQGPDEVFNDPRPLALPDALDDEALGRLLRKIEFVADRKGWGQPYAGLHLYVVFDARAPGIEAGYAKVMGSNPALGPALRMGPYRAQSIIPPSWLANFSQIIGVDKPWLVARRFAVNCTYSPPDPYRQTDPAMFRDLMRADGVIGFACVYEAWDRSHIASWRLDVAAPGFVDWGTLDGSLTVRVAMLVDALDRVHDLFRSKSTGVAMDVRHDAPVRGDLSTTLRVLTDMAYSRSPLPSRFAEHYGSLVAHMARGIVEGDEIREVERIVNGS